MEFILLFLTTCFLAYANGANDNFKGVATLFGSGTISYRQALWWSTLMTITGSLSSIYVAQMLIRNFSGKGLVPDTVASSPDFVVAVAAGAGITVILAALRGLPVSTTHSLTGALTGAGLVAVGLAVNFDKLGSSFFVPLLVSPLIALALGALGFSVLKWFRHRSAGSREYCLCISGEKKIVPATGPDLRAPAFNDMIPAFTVDTISNCGRQGLDNARSISLQKVVDRLHILSGGMVCFARGLNDTPKIVALLSAAKILNIPASMAVIAAAMAVGGLLNARKIADTMSKRITRMDHGQGFAANLVTAFLVLFASKWGVPVSTTHVSVGSLFGIGLVSGNGNRTVMSGILLSWFLTLPVAASIAALCYWAIR